MLKLWAEAVDDGKHACQIRDMERVELSQGVRFQHLDRRVECRFAGHGGGVEGEFLQTRALGKDLQKPVRRACVAE